MNNWPDELKIFTVLSTVKVLLEKASPTEGFGLEIPSESLAVINHAIDFFLDPENNEYPENISMQFGPTGPLQEISISNGWDKVFFKLADQFDSYSSCLKKKKAL